MTKLFRVWVSFPRVNPQKIYAKRQNGERCHDLAAGPEQESDSLWSTESAGSVYSYCGQLSME